MIADVAVCRLAIEVEEFDYLVQSSIVADTLVLMLMLQLNDWY